MGGYESHPVERGPKVVVVQKIGARLNAVQPKHQKQSAFLMEQQEIVNRECELVGVNSQVDVQTRSEEGQADLGIEAREVRSEEHPVTLFCIRERISTTS